jgi:signal transduction histidine kinase
VTSHGGHVSITSVSGHGTRFDIHFPVPITDEGAAGHDGK